MPNPTAPRAPDDHAATSDRALALCERLDEAAAEDLSANITRFLRFLDHADGDVIELQALGVPNKYARTAHFTHVRTVEDAVAALEHAESRTPTGSYVLFNAADPAVATRAASGAWHQAKRGESTTDRDVRARRAVYIDVDAERASGTSATEEEFGHAIAKAADILAWLEERVPVAAVGVGHSGNGASVLVALDHLPERPELALVVKALLAGLDHRFSDARAKVDRSVSNAKRLCPAFGTTKRKGAAGITERPHRRTGFVCADQVERLDEPALAALVQSLRDDLDDAGRALMDRELGVAGRARAATASARVTAANAWQLPVTTSPFALANPLPIADVVAWLGLDEGDGHVRCPGCGEADKGVAPVGNGLKCQHARCAGKGVRDGFRSVVDVVMEARGVDAKQALGLLDERFGLRLRDSGERGNLSSVASDTSAAARLTIDLSSLEEYEVNDLVSGELLQLEGIYQRMGRLVEVHEASVRRPGESEPGTRLEIRGLSEAVLRELITRVCAFEVQRLDRKTGELVPERAHPPGWCVRAVVHRGKQGQNNQAHHRPLPAAPVSPPEAERQAAVVFGADPPAGAGAGVLRVAHSPERAALEPGLGNRAAAAREAAAEARADGGRGGGGNAGPARVRRDWPPRPGDPRGALLDRHSAQGGDPPDGVGSRPGGGDADGAAGQGQEGLVMPPDAGVLFLTQEGEELSPHRLTQLVREHVSAAELGKTGACHLFRHTCATLMLEGSADVRYIQELLGHVELSTTQIYTRASIRKLKAVHTLTHPGARLGQRPVADGEDEAPAGAPGNVAGAKAVAVGSVSGRPSAEGFPCLAAEPALNVAVTEESDELDAEAAQDGARGGAQRPADAAGELMAASTPRPTKTPRRARSAPCAPSPMAPEPPEP